ncbi:YggS family pyridoxal phosphate-dependent enzyme [Sporosarcina sp. BP05]|uniref:YggS family pyridoxal phosphate-dependent enzyme n=1 Tax=Sporosarcina sp. BP05 TaxID=2758726 RepID=UPI0016479417|nr:YggS family pyridoxal phosphate-dependent enzyme [Sporosarcina sp. BP05]
MGNLQQRIQKIEQDIQATCDRVGRNRSEVTVVAVTKEVSAARTSAVLEENILHLGENRPEGLLGKQEMIQGGAIWHFIGNVQSRKVKEIINQIDYLHSIDRMSLVKEIHKRANHVVNCFIQVNVSGESSKSGVTPAELDRFIEEVAPYDKVRIIGLMTMAPFIKDMDEIRSVFRSLRELRDGISAKSLPHAPCTQLSMGMSNDFIIAIEEGATHVRIGTALVGAESEGDV